MQLTDKGKKEKSLISPCDTLIGDDRFTQPEMRNRLFR